MRDAELPDPPRVALGLEPRQVLAPTRRGCAPARPRRGRTSRADPRAGCALRRPTASRSSSARSPRRGGPRARRRAPAPTSTSARCRSSARRRRTPRRPRLGPARRRPGTCSTCRARRRGRGGAPPSAEHPACGDARGEGGTEEDGILVGASTHVREREPGAGFLPALAVRGRPARRCPRAPARARSRHGARRRGAARAASASDWRTARIGRPPSAAPTLAASASVSAPWPSREPVPTIPGPTAQTTASWPCAFAQASAAAVVTNWASPSRQGATAHAISDQTALAKRPHRVRQRHRQRAAGDLDVGDPRTGEPGAHRRHLAVQGAEDDRQPFERRRRARPTPPCNKVLLGRACTAAPSRARPPPPRARARASGSRRGRRSRRSRARAGVPAR